MLLHRFNIRDDTAFDKSSSHCIAGQAQPSNVNQDSLKAQRADQKAISMLDCDNYPQCGRLLQNGTSTVPNNRIFLDADIFA